VELEDGYWLGLGVGSGLGWVVFFFGGGDLAHGYVTDLGGRPPDEEWHNWWR
jgi:hypothetical protein